MNFAAAGSPSRPILPESSQLYGMILLPHMPAHGGGVPPHINLQRL